MRLLCCSSVYVMQRSKSAFSLNCTHGWMDDTQRRNDHERMDDVRMSAVVWSVTYLFYALVCLLEGIAETAVLLDELQTHRWGRCAVSCRVCLACICVCLCCVCALRPSPSVRSASLQSAPSSAHAPPEDGCIKKISVPLPCLTPTSAAFFSA